MQKILEDLGTAMAEFIPRLVGAVLVMVVALVVAIVLQRLVVRLLETLGLDEIAERTGASGSLQQLGYNGGPSQLLGLVLLWGVILTGVAGSLSVLGLSSLEQTMDQIVTLSGRALVALVILIAGIMAAGWLADLVARSAEDAGLRGSNVFKRAVFVTVIAVTGLVAAGQLGLETSVLIILAIVLLSTVGLITALALGQGLVPLSGNIAAGRYVQEDLAVGDEISVDGIEGTVEQLGYSAVTLRSEDGYFYRIPNRALLEGVVRKTAR
ncbi:MAG TPA: mechanosensitive ion channel domain-containing protein [Rubrobacteraceae bacterium]|nr:mechanosensitive ion channel domain-containing protein [Rubrobacteraceae bacterium]HLL56354.1 mechanosensitive ion channel domain-containing protein [Rubrobacteraceae bacterium]